MKDNLRRMDLLAKKWRKISYSPMNLAMRLIYAEVAGELETAIWKTRKSMKKSKGT